MNQKEYKDLVFTDDFMFCKIMQNNEDICKEVLQLILGCSIKEIRYPDVQKCIEITDDGKGIRLDVYLDDGKTVYDIEMQTTLNINLPKRSRYYQGMIDLNLIERGDDYSMLRESFVVFICLNDLFGKDLSIYTFKNLCMEDKSVLLDDKSTKVFVNASGNRGGLTAAQIAFLDYLQGKEATDDFTRRIRDAVYDARNKEKWRAEYMTLLQRDREKIAEGRETVIIEQIVAKIKKQQDISTIAEAVEKDEDTVRQIYDTVTKHAPDYDIDAIYEDLKSSV